MHRKTKNVCWLHLFQVDLQYCANFKYTARWFSYAAAAAESLQSCPTLCDPIDGSPPRLRRPWASPGKNTGMACHFLLQCMKVKSVSEVAQSCPTLCGSVDCSPPGSSVRGILQARILEWAAISFSRGVFPTQGSNPGLLHCRQMLRR